MTSAGLFHRADVPPHDLDRPPQMNRVRPSFAEVGARRGPRRTAQREPRDASRPGRRAARPASRGCRRAGSPGRPGGRRGPASRPSSRAPPAGSRRRRGTAAPAAPWAAHGLNRRDESGDQHGRQPPASRRVRWTPRRRRAAGTSPGVVSSASARALDPSRTRRSRGGHVVLFAGGPVQCRASRAPGRALVGVHPASLTADGRTRCRRTARPPRRPPATGPVGATR